MDKPEGISSHKAVGIIRRLAGQRKVGHAGTLDPMASGVLPIFLGNACRVIEYMSEKDDPEAKVYLCKMQLGVVTDTQDGTGEIVEAVASDYIYPRIDEIALVLNGFIGMRKQVPPMYSAVKLNGKRLYQLAREGKTVDESELKLRMINVNNIMLTNFDTEYHNVEFEITCTGGTYVRTICHDVGQELGCGGIMTALRRLKSGPFTIEESYTPEVLESMIDAGEELPIIPMDRALVGLPRLDLSKDDGRRFVNGLKLDMGPASSAGTGCVGQIAVYCEDSLLGIGISDGVLLRPKKVIA
jgi:tRNA pseudouridine55 synthase